MKASELIELTGDYLKSKDTDEIEYKIVSIEEDNQTKRFLFAIGEQWASDIEGTILFKIIDTGNGIKIPKKYMELLQDEEGEGANYHNIEYLRILLNHNNVASHLPNVYNVLVDSEVEI